MKDTKNTERTSIPITDAIPPVPFEDFFVLFVSFVVKQAARIVALL